MSDMDESSLNREHFSAMMQNTHLMYDNQKEEGHKKADQNKAELYPDEEE